MRITGFSFGNDLRAGLAHNLAAFATDIAAADAHAAAVAMTLVPEGEEAAFVLTRRSLDLKNHPGQFALPGGRIDAGETPEAAARRELWEEVGVEVDGGAVLGRLDDFVTRSGFAITPVIIWAGDVELHPNPAEVHAVFRIPIGELDRPDAPRLTEIPESDRPVLSMPIAGDFVFAPTAAVLYQFREVAMRGEGTRVGHFEQPVFAWR